MGEGIEVRGKEKSTVMLRGAPEGHGSLLRKSITQIDKELSFMGTVVI